MNSNLQNQLIQLYRDGMTHFLPDSKGISREVINCDDGWFELIEDTLLKIKALSRKFNDGVVIESIGVKFGELRIFLEFAPTRGEYWDKVWKIIEDAGEKSFQICEVCGKSGSCYELGLSYKVLCNKCYQERTEKVSYVGEKL